MAFGNEVLNYKETEIQKHLATKIPMIPFSVFAEAKLDLNTMKLIDRGPEETVTRKREVGENKDGTPKFIVEKVHFTGASLFTVGDKTFLFDIDRVEIKNQIFNPFLVEISSTKNVKTIEIGRAHV